MELLTVIAIIGIMAVVAISATSQSGAGTGSKQGAIMASSILALTRSEAVQKQGYAVLVVDALQDPSNPGNFLHRLMVCDASSAPGWANPNILTQVSLWYNLPSSVYFDTTYSTSSTGAVQPTVPVTINNSSGQIFIGPVYTYTFTPAGQLTAAAQMVFAVGHGSPSLPSTLLFEDGTSGTQDTRQGFYIHTLGRPSFFQTPGSIPAINH